jgi:hypothetical protein
LPQTPGLLCFAFVLSVIQRYMEQGRRSPKPFSSNGMTCLRTCVRLKERDLSARRLGAASHKRHAEIQKIMLGEGGGRRMPQARLQGASQTTSEKGQAFKPPFRIVNSSGAYLRFD